MDAELAATVRSRPHCDVWYAFCKLPLVIISLLGDRLIVRRCVEKVISLGEIP